MPTTPRLIRLLAASAAAWFAMLAAGCEAPNASPDMPSPTSPPPQQTECPEETTSDATVKVLLALDVSGSLQFTDQLGERLRAVRDLMSTLSTEQNVFVNTVAFGAQVRSAPRVRPGDDVFIPASQWTEPSFLSLADVYTDFQTALETVRAMLQLDMEQSSAEDLAQTRYVVILFSDSAPTPVCCTMADETPADDGTLPFGCGTPQTPPADEAAVCDGTAELALCNDASYLFAVRDSTDMSESPELDAATPLASLVNGGELNRPHQLEAATAAIVDLKDSYGVLDVAVHTRLLFDPNLDAEVQNIYQLNHCVASSTLMNMASTGRGTYAEFDVASSISFLDINTSGRMCFR